MLKQNLKKLQTKLKFKLNIILQITTIYNLNFSKVL